MGHKIITMVTNPDGKETRAVSDWQDSGFSVVQ